MAENQYYKVTLSEEGKEITGFSGFDDDIYQISQDLGLDQFREDL